MKEYFNLSIWNLVTMEEWPKDFEIKTFVLLLAIQRCWSISHAQCVVMSAGSETFPTCLELLFLIMRVYQFNGSTAVTQLVEALRYKPEGHGVDLSRYHWDVPLPSSFRPQYVPRVDSALNRNEYQGYLLGSQGRRCVGLRTLRPSRANCLEILGPSTCWSPKGLSTPV